MYLEIKELSKSYGTKCIIEDIDKPAVLGYNV